MKKAVLFLASVMTAASFGVGASAEADTQSYVALSAKPIVGRTITVTNQNGTPSNVSWTASDEENGEYTEIAGASGTSLYVDQNLMGKWIKVNADGAESAAYQETSTKATLMSEDFSEYTGGILAADEDGNKYLSERAGNQISFKIPEQTEGRIGIEYRFKHTSTASDATQMVLSGSHGNGHVTYFWHGNVLLSGMSDTSPSGSSFGNSYNDGSWHNLKMIVNLGNNEMELYLDGDRKTADGTRLNTKYLKTALSTVTFNFFDAFCMDDLHIYSIEDENLAPYVEGELRILTSVVAGPFNTPNYCVVKDYDGDSVTARYEFSYADTADGEYTVFQQNPNQFASAPYNGKYLKAVVTACDSLGKKTVTTIGPVKVDLSRDMPAMGPVTVSGDASVGGKLTRKNPAAWGAWGIQDAGTKWYRCTAPTDVLTDEMLTGLGGEYTVKAKDAGKYIIAEVTFNVPELGYTISRKANPIYCPKFEDIKNDGTSAIVTVAKSTEHALSFDVLNTCYDDGRMVNSEAMSVTLPEKAAYVTVTAPFSVQSGNKVKGFVWRSLESLIPFAGAGEYIAQ